jgi:hypothetical protein
MNPKIEAALQHIQTAISSSSGKIDEAVMAAIYNNGLFKCVLPKSVGGLELSMQELMKLIEDCAAINGSLGWLMQLGNGANFFYPLYEPAVGDQLFSPTQAVFAGSGAATGIATPTQDGFIVSGEWKYCSGAEYATMFTANCIYGNEVIACTMLPEQIEVISDWNTIGLKQTSTYTIRAYEIFVPHELTFRLNVVKNKVDNSVFDIPFVLFAKLLTIKVQHGLLRALLAEAKRCAVIRIDKWTQIYDQIEIVNAYLFQSIESIEELASLITNPVDGLEQIIYAEVAAQNTKIVQHAYELWHMCGIDVVYTNNRMAECFTDMLVAGQHSLLRNTKMT